jgi:hypothetical protein
MIFNDNKSASKKGALTSTHIDPTQQPCVLKFGGSTTKSQKHYEMSRLEQA